MTFTKEEMEILSTMEDKLYTATYCKFVRLASREQLEKIDKVYKRAFNAPTGAIGACAHCLLNICKKLGEVYFKDKKEMEEMANKPQNEPIEATEETKQVEQPVKPKKTATTKKKTNKKK